MNPYNPYAPPEIRGEAPPRQEDWYTQGTTIYVSDGAVLPAIDLEKTGEASDSLVEVRRKFSIAGATLGIWGIIPGLFNLVPWEWKRMFRPSKDDVGVLIAACVVLMALHLFVIFWRPGALGKCVRFRMHQNPESGRKAKHTKIVIAVWYSLSVLCSFYSVFILLKSKGITGNTTLVYTWMGIGVASMFACMVWQFFRLPKIRYKGFSGKWLRLHGACDEALTHLRKIESERALHPAE